MPCFYYSYVVFIELVLYLCYMNIISMHESLHFIQLMLSWCQRAKIMDSLWVTNTTNWFYNYKADMCKAKRAALNVDRNHCSLLRTDAFIADLCLSTSHSATVCGGKRISLVHCQEAFGHVRLSAFNCCSEGFARYENFPEIWFNKFRWEWITKCVKYTKRQDAAVSGGLLRSQCVISKTMPSIRQVLLWGGVVVLFH